MVYLGDFEVGQLVNHRFTTTDGVNPRTFTSPTLLVIRESDQTTSAAGLTLSVDSGSRTGNNLLSLNTAADGAFYAAGIDFSVIVTVGTVGGSSVVGYTVCEFSIENRVAPTITDITNSVQNLVGNPAQADDGRFGNLSNLDAPITSRLADEDYVSPPSAASIAAGLLDLADGVETNLTVRQSLRGFAALLLGKSTDDGATFRDTNDTKDRITATVDGDGNRTAVTLDLA